MGRELQSVEAGQFAHAPLLYLLPHLHHVSSYNLAKFSLFREYFDSISDTAPKFIYITPEYRVNVQYSYLHAVLQKQAPADWETACLELCIPLSESTPPCYSWGSNFYLEFHYVGFL